ncbi:hypothetical protein [Rhizobium phage RHph_X3_2]|nr:hypothetical protein [Rhizobium phage RHph_X3_2]
MAAELYVVLCRPAGEIIAVQGPFEEAQTNEIYGAIEQFEKDYRLGDQLGLSLLEGGKVKVVKTVYVKDQFL